MDKIYRLGRVKQIVQWIVQLLIIKQIVQLSIC